MTENEAINILQLNRPFAYSELQSAVDVAIQALEEIRQYRAIGTVEELQTLKEHIGTQVLRQYEAIGTIEEFKALKENQRECKDCAGCTTWKCDCANIRAKAIDEVLETVKKTYHNFSGYDLEKMTKYGNESAEQQHESYSTLMLYEIAGEFDDLIDALEQLKATN